MEADFEDWKHRFREAKDLFEEYVDLDDPVHQFGLVIVVLLPTYVLTSGNNPFAGIPLYQLAVLAVVIAVMMFTDFGEDWGADAAGEKSVDQVSAEDVQVHE